MSTHTRELDGEEERFGVLGASVFGGRPTFGLVRDESGGQSTMTLYELLPREQAEARRERLERVSHSVSVEPVSEVIDTDREAMEPWSWDEWAAIEVARLGGTRLRAILGLVRETLDGADIDHRAVTSTRGDEVVMPEQPGVRLSVGFLGVEELRRVDRMRALARGVAGMSDEECYYWYAKCQSPNSPNGVQALRTLLTNHIK